MKTLRTLALALLLAVVGLIIEFVTTPAYPGARSDHFDGSRFFDPDFTHPSFGDVLHWQWNRDLGPWEQRGLRYGPATPPARNAAGVHITLVNHATLLLQFADVNVLTDPIWSDHSGPFGAVGPERFAPPGVPFNDLPAIDAVVVSHNHYDHMDMPTLKRLAADPSTVFVVPLGNGHYLRSAGIDAVVEIDWWQSHGLDGGLTITAVPAKHWSRRRPFDENRALWAGFVMRHDRARVYFAGDSGTGEHFGEIKRRLGAPDVALLPIGAYLPAWFMHTQHMSPAEAVTANEHLGAHHAVAIHFGTFPLGDDGQDRPLVDLRAALARTVDDRFWAPTNGESRVFGFSD